MTVNVIFPNILDVFYKQFHFSIKNTHAKLRQILGLSHLLIYSKRDQCKVMFCVSLLASHLFAYT